MVDWFREFLQTLPLVFRALWEFGGGMRGLLVSVGSVVVIVAFLLLAAYLRPRQGWQSAVAGTMAALVAGYWIFGIIPSAWINFASGQEPLMEGVLIPAELVTPAVSIGPIHIPELEVATEFYTVIVEIITVTVPMIGMAVLAFVALLIQKRYPRTLADDEEPRPTTGGRTELGVGARP